MDACFVSRNLTHPQGASAPSEVGDSLLRVSGSETHTTLLCNDSVASVFLLLGSITISLHLQCLSQSQLIEEKQNTD